MMGLGDSLKPSHPETGTKEGLKVWTTQTAFGVPFERGFRFLLLEALLGAELRSWAKPPSGNLAACSIRNLCNGTSTASAARQSLASSPPIEVLHYHTDYSASYSVKDQRFGIASGNFFYAQGLTSTRVCSGRA
jgi:hypothetical protein